MEFEQESLINEVLGLSRTRKYFPWGPWPAKIGTLKSRLRRIWKAGDYDRVSRYTQIEAEGFYRRLPVGLDPDSSMSRAAPANWR